MDDRFKEFHDRVTCGLLLRRIHSCRLIFEFFRFFKGREVGGLRFVILILVCDLLDLVGIGKGVQDIMRDLTLLREKLQH